MQTTFCMAQAAQVLPTQLSDGGVMGSGTQRALSGTLHASILFLLFSSIRLFSPGLASGFPSWLLFSLGFCLPTLISLLHPYFIFSQTFPFKFRNILLPL